MREENEVGYKTKPMKYLIISLLFFSTAAFAQEEEDIPDYNTEMRRYVLNPQLDDSLCRNDIKRAKDDIAKGKIAFTQQVGFLFGFLRYEDELKLLCKEAGLYYEIVFLSDVVFEGQTQGCYGFYMDNMITEKYGDDFKPKMHKKADSLFLVNVNSKNKAVQYYNCDERPRLPNELKRTDDYLPDITIEEPKINPKNGWPFFDIGFIVEKDSTITNFYLESFVAQRKRYEKYKDELYNVVVKYIQENYPVWVPGKVLGIPVRTDNNVRIRIINE